MKRRTEKRWRDRGTEGRSQEKYAVKSNLKKRVLNSLMYISLALLAFHWARHFRVHHSRSHEAI